MLGHFLFVQTYLLIGLPWVSTETVGTFINVSMPQYGQRKKCGLSISTSCLPKIASILLNAFVIQLRGIFSMLGLLSFSHFYSGVLTPFLRRVNLSKLLIPLKLPFLAIRELLILILKYCYGCRIDVPDGLNRVGNELFRRR